MNNEQNNKTFCLRLNVLKNKIEWSKGFGAFMTSIPFSNVIIVFLSSWDEITTLCSLKMKTSPISMITIQLDKCKGHIHLFWSLAMSSFNVGYPYLYKLCTSKKKSAITVHGTTRNGCNKWELLLSSDHWLLQNNYLSQTYNNNNHSENKMTIVRLIDSNGL